MAVARKSRWHLRPYQAVLVIGIVTVFLLAADWFLP